MGIVRTSPDGGNNIMTHRKRSHQQRFKMSRKRPERVKCWLARAGGVINPATAEDGQPAEGEEG